MMRALIFSVLCAASVGPLDPKLANDLADFEKHEKEQELAFKADAAKANPSSFAQIRPSLEREEELEERKEMAPLWKVESGFKSEEAQMAKQMRDLRQEERHAHHESSFIETESESPLDRLTADIDNDEQWSNVQPYNPSSFIQTDDKDDKADKSADPFDKLSALIDSDQQWNPVEPYMPSSFLETDGDLNKLDGDLADLQKTVQDDANEYANDAATAGINLGQTNMFGAAPSSLLQTSPEDKQDADMNKAKNDMAIFMHKLQTDINHFSTTGAPSSFIETPATLKSLGDELNALRTKMIADSKHIESEANPSSFIEMESMDADGWVNRIKNLSAKMKSENEKMQKQTDAMDSFDTPDTLGKFINKEILTDAGKNEGYVTPEEDKQIENDSVLKALKELDPFAMMGGVLNIDAKVKGKESKGEREFYLQPHKTVASSFIETGETPKNNKMLKMIDSANVNTPDSWMEAEGYPSDEKSSKAFTDLDKAQTLFMDLKKSYSSMQKKTRSDISDAIASAKKNQEEIKKMKAHPSSLLQFDANTDDDVQKFGREAASLQADEAKMRAIHNKMHESSFAQTADYSDIDSDSFDAAKTLNSNFKNAEDNLKALTAKLQKQAKASSFIQEKYDVLNGDDAQLEQTARLVSQDQNLLARDAKAFENAANQPILAGEPSSFIQEDGDHDDFAAARKKMQLLDEQIEADAKQYKFVPTKVESSFAEVDSPRHFRHNAHHLATHNKKFDDNFKLDFSKLEAARSAMGAVEDKLRHNSAEFQAEAEARDYHHASRESLLETGGGNDDILRKIAQLNSDMKLETAAVADEIKAPPHSPSSFAEVDESPMEREKLDQVTANLKKMAEGFREGAKSYSDEAKKQAEENQEAHDSFKSSSFIQLPEDRPDTNDLKWQHGVDALDAKFKSESDSWASKASEEEAYYKRIEDPKTAEAEKMNGESSFLQTTPEEAMEKFKDLTKKFNKETLKAKRDAAAEASSFAQTREIVAPMMVPSEQDGQIAAFRRKMQDQGAKFKSGLEASLAEMNHVVAGAQPSSFVQMGEDYDLEPQSSFDDKLQALTDKMKEKSDEVDSEMQGLSSNFGGRNYAEDSLSGDSFATDGADLFKPQADPFSETAPVQDLSFGSDSFNADGLSTPTTTDFNSFGSLSTPNNYGMASPMASSWLETKSKVNKDEHLRKH